MKTLLSKPANYIYHMLSAAKCGYDNAYGTHARNFHSTKDMDYLESVKDMITVCGGEHCGELYSLCICKSASFDSTKDMLTYFDSLIDLLQNGLSLENYNTYFKIYEKSFVSENTDLSYSSFDSFYQSLLPFKESIIKIFQILSNNYEIYYQNFWTNTYNELYKVAKELDALFIRDGYQQKWEEMLGAKYKYDNFYIVLCNSIAGGAQAIDISPKKDVFALPHDDLIGFCQFVSHEFGIYLLQDILQNSNAFHSLATYKYTESLAEYYNQIICKGNTSFHIDEDIIKQCHMYNPDLNMSPSDLYDKIIEENTYQTIYEKE